MVYKSSKKDLEKAKEKGISDKLKKVVASAIIAGSVLTADNLAQANVAQDKYYGFTQEEVSEHNERVNEVSSYASKIKPFFEESNVKSAFKNNLHLSDREAKKVYSEYSNDINSFRESSVNFLDKEISLGDELKGDPESIKDKKGISMQVLSSGDSNSKPKISLNIDYIGQLDDKQLEYLQKNYDISDIKIHRFYNNFKEPTYDFETYKKMSTKMNELLGDIKDNPNLSDLDKTLLVLKRIKSNVPYDQTYYDTKLDEAGQKFSIYNNQFLNDGSNIKRCFT